MKTNRIQRRLKSLYSLQLEIAEIQEAVESKLPSFKGKKKIQDKIRSIYLITLTLAEDLEEEVSAH